MTQSDRIEGMENDENKVNERAEARKKRALARKANSESRKAEKKAERQAEREQNGPFGFMDHISKLAYGGYTLLFTIIATFIVMIVACLAVFFASLHSAEQVMVPNVVGKSLTSAIYEMQQKELYPRVTLRYSDYPGEAGTVLDQTPQGGAIVKAYRQIELTVSRGMATTRVGDYVGKDIDTVKPALDLEFTGERPLISVAPVILQESDLKPGTIISQYPEADYYIYDPVTMYFVVSSGHEKAKTKVPSLKGKTIGQILGELPSYSVVFECTSHTATGDEIPNTVVSQSVAEGTEVDRYSTVKLDFALAERTEDSTLISGVFEADLAEYPFPISMRLDSRTIDGEVNTLCTFAHPGNKVSIPYVAAPETTLLLYVADQKMAEVTVQ